MRAHSIESIHLTGAVIVAVAVIGVVLLQLILGSAVGVEVLWTIALGTAFIGMTGWHYQHRLHSYVVIGGVVYGVWSSVSYFAGRPFNVALFDGALVATSLGLCFGFALTAIALQRWRGGFELAELADSLYRRALRTTSLWLALGVALQQLWFSFRIVSDGDVPGGMMLAFAGLAMLIANHALASMRWSSGGVVLVAIGGYGLLFGLIAASDMLIPHPLTAVLLVCLGVAAAWVLNRHNEFAVLYLAPTRFMTSMVYAGALLSAAVSAPFVVFLGRFDFLLTSALLVVTTFPVIRGPSAALWRGLILPLLMSALFFGLWSNLGEDRFDGRIAIAWGFALSAVATFTVDVWNRRFQRWRVGSVFWPWLGLVFVVVGGAEVLLEIEFLWVYLIALSVYLGLMLRHTGSGIFAWLCAAAATLAGLAATDWWLLGLVAGRLPPLTLSKFLPTLVWLNVLLGLGSWWRRRGAGTLPGRLGLPVDSLSSGFTVLPALLLLPLLVVLTGGGLALSLDMWLGHAVRPSFGVAALCTALGMSGLHAAVCLHRNVMLRLGSLHGVWLCLYLTMLYAFAASGHDTHSGLASALWALGFALIHTRWGIGRDVNTLWGALSAALPVWVGLVATVAGVLMIFSPVLLIGERLAVLFTLAVVVGLQGWWRASRAWLCSAAVMFMVFQHVIWLAWFAPLDLIPVLPFMALISIALALVLHWVVGWVSTSAETTTQAVLETRRILIWSASFLPALAAFEVTVHGLFLLTGALWVRPEWTVVSSVLLTYLLLVAIWIRRAHRTQNELWIYAAALLGGAAFVHLRTIWFGVAPVTPWDTAILIGAAYGLFVIQRMTLSVSTLHVVLVLPLIALVTLPVELGSIHTGSALISISVLYLLIRGTTGNILPLYLGFMMLNGAMYLWVPLWAGQSGLLQLYVIPAAASVLVLLQLHQRELKPSVLNGGRLAALSVLYVAGSVDMFAQPGLGVFALAVGLAIIGIGVGIMVRIRAFLYAGVAFLVLNVGAQLLVFYPEQRLGRAVLLLVLGMVITGGMILFNIKREAIGRRIRGLRADLAEWQ